MKIKSMPRFITFLVILFVIISCITNLFISKVFSHEIEKYNHVTVCEGDSLWTIATALGGNVNENIYHIKKINQLDSSIVYVGQNLLIPDTSI